MPLQSLLQRHIRFLDEGLLNSPFSLTKARTLYQLAHHEQSTAVELCKELVYAVLDPHPAQV